jgi:hypothetical protein
MIKRGGGIPCVDGKANIEAHSFMPEAPERAAALAGLAPSTHVPEANPRAAAQAGTYGSHSFLPEAVPAQEQSLRQRHSGSGSPQGTEEPIRAKAAYVAPEPKQAGLRSSLTKLAHRWGSSLKS